MKRTFGTTVLGLVASLCPAIAQADCSALPDGRILCDGSDPDGFVSPLTGQTVVVTGTIASPGDGLRLGPGPTVVNSGAITGAEDGIDAPVDLDLTNSGTVTGGSGAAVATLSGAVIGNPGGTIRGLTGAAITSGIGLDLQNAGGLIEALASEAALRAGQGATIRNRVGGTIRGTFGPAVDASLDLDLQNGASSDILGIAGIAVEAGLRAQVRNAGRIEGLSGGIALGAGSRLTNAGGGTILGETGPAVNGAGGVTITNETGGTIEARATAPALSLDLNDTSVVTNRGRIVSRGREAVDIDAPGGLRLGNGATGEIENATGDGILFRAGRLDVRNAGRIRTGGVAIRQTGGRLDLTNERGGHIVSDRDAAVVAGTADIINAEGARIAGADGAIRLSGGSIENDGTIETDGGDSAITVGRSPRDVTVTNRGVISGATGLRFDAGHDGDRQIENAGRIAGTARPAIEILSDLGRSTLKLRDDSEILGDILFGSADDTLRLMDITSDVLATGVFDGGAGADFLLFDDSYAETDILSLAFLDPITVDIGFRTERGDALSGIFRNFETIRIGGATRSFDDLREASIVPVPATLPLMLAALGVFGAGAAAARRRGAAGRDCVGR